MTLVELLVVIALIGLLCALLLPTLARAKVAALSTQCRNNEKQIGVAMRSFVIDHNAYPPENLVSLPPNPPPIYRLFFQALAPYTASVSTGAVYHCPAFKRLLSLDPPPDGGKPLPVYAPQTDSDWGSYGWNATGLGGGLGLTAEKESEVKNPANMIALGDAFQVNQNTGTTPLHVNYGLTRLAINVVNTPSNPTPFDQYDYAEEFAGARHGGNLDVLFADGHVEIMQWRQLLYDHSDDALRKWNRDNKPHPEFIR